MEEKYKVIAKITEIVGNQPCEFGHKVGEEFEFTLYKTPNICNNALAALLPAIHTLLCGGNFPWTDNSEVTTWGCPHPKEGQVIFELKRIRIEKS